MFVLTEPVTCIFLPLFFIQRIDFNMIEYTDRRGYLRQRN